MSDSAPFHGTGAPAGDDGVPQPSLAERARTLVAQGGTSTLSTLSRKHPGYPFGSLMPYGIDEDGSPLFLISSMAMHTRNLEQNPRCTLLIVQAAVEGEALGAGRISIMGDARVVVETDSDRIRALYLQRNPSAQNWVNYGDFAFYRLSVLDVYFVGGFGIMGWITAEQYHAAAPDPLTHAAAEIISHMNQDHVDAMISIAEHLGGVTATEAVMTAVDYLGFSLRLKTDRGFQAIRIPFKQPLQAAADARQAMIQLVEEART